MDCPVLIAGSSADNKLCISSQTMSSYEDVACMGDFVDEDFIDGGFDSDMGSGAEFSWTTRDDACEWESWSASENFLPDSDRALPAVSVKDVVYYRDDSKYPDGDVCYTGINSVSCRDRYVDGDRYRLCLLRRPSRRDIGVWNNDNVNDWGLKYSCIIDWYVDATPIAVCYDCLCFIGFFRTVRSMFYDGDETLECTGHSEADGYALVGYLGYIPWCLCSPLVVNGMTQSLTEFKGPGGGLIFSETRYAGGRRCVCTCLTPPVICSAVGSSRHLIGGRVVRA